MTMLIKVLQNSEGPVMELGGGPFSTPLLHWLCKMQGRKMVTYESDPQYYQLCRGFQSSYHKVRFVSEDNWDSIPLENWGVIFIDHHPDERRVIDLIKFKDHADYIIMHDTEKEEKYGLKKAYPLFKQIHVWDGCKPWTSVFSNKKELSFLK
jgi:hypothetical protein